MAGTTPLSLVQQFDASGAPLAGGLLTFFVAGTVATKQNIFQDFGLTVPLANPLTLDSTGRVPQHWIADGLIHIRLTDFQGLQYIDTTMQVLGPSSGGGGGGGGTVDPTALMATGDLKHRYGTGPLAGFVRANALTIGNASSGATERANADTQNLFIYLYGIDANLVVAPGGRTGNALNDYNANKTIATPDSRGRALFSLDDMGNTSAGRLSSTYAGVLPTTLGSAGGAESETLTLAQLPTGISSSVVTAPNGNPGNFVPVNSTGWTFGTAGGGATIVPSSLAGATIVGTNSFTGTATSTNTSAQPHPIASPMILVTTYLKL